MLKPLTEQTGAIVLAGGRSTRMGVDKSGLPLGKKTLLKHVVLETSRLASQVIVILNRDQQELSLTTAPGCHIQFGRDSKDRQGPLQGIADGVSLLKDDIRFCYVLSCDLPYLTTDWLLKLRERLTGDVDVVCTCVDTITNPLIALYRKEILLAAPRLLAQKQFRPIRLWDGKNIVPIIPSPTAVLNPGVNVNTPREFITVVQRLHQVLPVFFTESGL